MKRRRWYLYPSLPTSLKRRRPDLPPLLLQLFHNRGIALNDPWEAFLRADEGLLHDPYLLPDMATAVSRIKEAVASQEMMAIYGDFDADGITATVLLTQVLLRLGGKAIPYIPHRLEEGYGLNIASLQGLAGQGVKLVVTVDCGVSAAPEVEAARKLGLEVIITDHHSAPSYLPPALAVIDPHRPNSTYPCPHLAGVGVAFKLCQALGWPASGQGLLGLVALGTVADMMPLLGENRYFVKKGLQEMDKLPGIRELAAVAGLSPELLDAEALSYVLTPRLNATGRLDHALKSYHLLVTASTEEARPLAQELESLNRERQQLTAQALDRARAMVDASQPLLFAGAPDFHPGVVGIVAGKLAEEFYRPAVVLEVGEEVSRGSARSIPEFNIIEALRQCRDLLLRFGGHPQAAGFSISTASIPELRSRLLSLAGAELSGLDLRPSLAIDAEIKLSSLNKPELLGLIESLAPYGQGNPAPTFLTRRARLVERRTMGQDGRHLRLKFRDGEITWAAVAFDQASSLPDMTERVDIVYRLGVDRLGRTPILRLQILDMAPCQP